MITAMQEAGLDPGEVIPDGKLHRFDVPGDRPRSQNGWYVLFDDGDNIQGGRFGSWKTGANIVWSSRKPTDFSPAEKKAYAAKMEAARRQREAERQKVAEECRAWCKQAWADAKPATDDHPYLKRKGVKAYGLKLMGDALIAPVCSLDRTIHGIQFIQPDGTKKFKTGSAKQEHFHLIGKPVDGTMIVCEGYATGASIHEATGYGVLVAFDAGNLKPVAESIHKQRPHLRIIVAADDDQWTAGNPGATKAAEAAKAVGGAVVFPRFVSLETKPTDFNDLGTLEGVEAVRRQILEPLPPVEQEGPPPPADAPAPAPPPIEGEAEPEFSLDTAPFQLLGYDHGEYFFLAHGNGQVKALTADKLTKAHLLTLAPLQWWQGAFPARTSFDEEAARNMLIQKSHARGIYDADNVRGLGAWEDAGRSVLHLGDKLKVDGVPVPLSTFRSRYLYERAISISGEETKPLGTKEAHKLLELCDMLSWEKPINGRLLAGWCVDAIICGALKWRPHIWLTGPSGSGKAQPHTAKVLTPQGWTTMGDLKVGDYVTTPDNSYGKVLQVHPQGRVPVYKVTFSDGRSTRATAEHLWKVRANGDWRLKTTLGLIDALGFCGSKVAAPLAQPLDIIDNGKVGLPIHPYILGALLGDGHLATIGKRNAGQIKITVYDDEIRERIKQFLPDDVFMDTTNHEFEYSFKHLSSYGAVFRTVLKDLALLGSRSYNKFIPQAYLDANIEDRFHLLQGLMDTDGTAGTGGSMSFCTVSPQLAEDVAYLVRSLGGCAKISEKKTHFTHKGVKKEGLLAYNISIRFADRSQLFHLKRKSERVNKIHQYLDCTYLQVESVVPDGEEESSCISIDHPERLYVTDDFVVTHNSWVIHNIIKPAIGPHLKGMLGSTTEAGLRNALRNDAFSVFFDEFEAEDKHAAARIQSILEFARPASSNEDSKIYKAKSGGGGVNSYQPRSCIGVASINVNMSQKADISRVSVLSLVKGTRERFDEIIVPFWAEHFTPEFYRALRARTIALIPVIIANAEVFQRAITLLLGNRRGGDQYGALLAGAYSLCSSSVATFDQAKEWVGQQDWDGHAATEDQSDELQCLSAILEGIVKHGQKERSIGELLAATQGTVTYEEKETLLRHGIKCQDGYFIIANSHSGIARILEKTPWAGNWGRILGRLDGCLKTGAERFGGGVSRGVVLPMSYIE